MLATRLLIAAACLSFTGGCAATPADEAGNLPSAEVTAPSGFEVRVASGQSNSIERTGLTIALVAIEGDSRCPKGETCVWEGSATVLLSVTDAAGDRDLTLHSSRRAGPASAIHDGWTIEFVALEPYPVAGREIAPTDYVVTLRITQGDPAIATK